MNKTDCLRLAENCVDRIERIRNMIAAGGKSLKLLLHPYASALFR